ncbi:MAG: winged helix-turn-helix transcriptional regulator [Chloroflexi bacterium]|nr:winged helix-turn-helix transcriptional regulator [Chloroflexota bacterium]
MFKDEILENENRRKIYEAIERSPGIHLRELQRILDMPLTTLEYHLSYMARKKIIYSETDTHYKRYYAKPLNDEDKKVLSALRQKRLREIVLLILANGKAKYQFMADYLKIPHSTLSFYLKYLVDNGILLKDKVGYETIYTVKDEDKVIKVLVAYKASFLDKLIDKTVAMWLETYTREERTP